MKLLPIKPAPPVIRSVLNSLSVNYFPPIHLFCSSHIVFHFCAALPCIHQALNNQTPIPL
jgi:hypothetical protein